jgi:hypothetical protein
LRESYQALRSGLRAEVRGLPVPLSGLCNIGLDADGAELLHFKRVERLSQHQRGTSTAGISGTSQQKPRRGEIANLQKILGAINERGDRVGIEPYSW